MPNVTEWRIWARKLAWVRHVFDVAGNASWALGLIAGLTLMTATLGFIYEHPAVTIAASVVVAYYSFRLFEQAQEWWRRESLDHKLVVLPQQVRLSRVTETHADVFVVFVIKNESGVDVAFVVDDEDFAVGDIHAEPTDVMPPFILRPGGEQGQTSGCIRSVPIGQHVSAACKLTIRYGSDKRRLNIRFFSAFALRLPNRIVKEGAPSAEDSHTVRRNDYEWISV